MRNRLTPLALTKPFGRAYQFRELLEKMTKRAILARYRGSWLGIFWSLLTPLLLLLIYMFVFGVVFQTRWPQTGEGGGNFAPLLFCGIIVHLLFAEVLNTAPRLIVDNANYVKKVVFPLDILSWISLGTAAFHFLVALFILLVFVLFSNNGLSWTVLYVLPLTAIFLIHLLGMSWLVSACGVYIRDISYVAGFISTAMVFISPVFYPSSAVKGAFAVVMDVNPLTFYIEAFRSVVVYGEPIALADFSFAAFLSLLSFLIGFLFFERVKDGFADVL